MTHPLPGPVVGNAYPLPVTQGEFLGPRAVIQAAPGPLPGVDVLRFQEAVQSSGVLGYVDTLSGGSISKLGIFSLGIIPYIVRTSPSE